MTEKNEKYQKAVDAVTLATEFLKYCERENINKNICQAAFITAFFTIWLNQFKAHPKQFSKVCDGLAKIYKTRYKEEFGSKSKVSKNPKKECL